MYEHSRIIIARHLQSVKQRLHLTLDGWTSPNVFSFLGVTVVYFEEGKLSGFVPDFVRYCHISDLSLSISDLYFVSRMSGRHTGEHLALELEALLKSFGIHNKVCHLILNISPRKLTHVFHEILSIVCDNATNNDGMINMIELEGFRGAAGRVRCFPHILNLAVKVM
jgi:hypothetical protein